MTHFSRSYFRASNPTLVALLGVSLCCGLAFGQIAGGSIAGNVVDPSGAAVVGAKIEATNVGTGIVERTVTLAEGEYLFPLLPVGRYIIQAEKDGFQKATTVEIPVNAGTRPKIDFQLRVGSSTQSVEVVATAPIVNATTTDLGVVIDSHKIRQLPLNGRDFSQLISLQPGFETGSTSGKFEVNGGGADSNNFLLDGVDMSDGENNGPASGTLGFSPLISMISVDAIEEFKTTSSAYSAEYGRNVGAVINLTTRAGTNQFHGTLLFFLRNDALDANTFFANRSRLAKPFRKHDQWGGNLGGPILKNRLFFFFNEEGARVAQAVEVSGGVATPLFMNQVQNPAIRAALQNLPSSFTPTSNPLLGFSDRFSASLDKELVTTSRVDYYFRKNQIVGRLVWNEQQKLTPQIIPTVSYGYNVPVRNVGLQDNFTISPTMLNEFRFGFGKTDLDRSAYQNGKPQDGTISSIIAPGLSQTASGSGLLFSGYKTYTVADNFSWIRNKHALKMGMEFHQTSGLRRQDAPNYVYYNSLQDVINDTPYAAQVILGNPGLGSTINNYGFYFQDDFRLSRRVQLSYGARYEVATAPTQLYNTATNDYFGAFAPLGTPVHKTDKNNLVPRLGIVIDLFGNGKTILRTGGGISTLTPPPFFYTYLATQPGGLPFAALFNVADLPASLLPLKFPFPSSFRDTLINNPALLPKGLALPRSLVDRNLADAYLGQWNFTIQHALTNTASLQAAYVGSRGVKLDSALTAGNYYNLVNPATGTRPQPQFGLISVMNDGGRSRYNALQVSFNQHLSHGFLLDGYWTWSKNLSYGLADIGGYELENPNNIAADYGPKASDIRHRFTFVPSYEMPHVAAFAKSRALDAVLGGWTVQGIINYRTGLPVNITTGQDTVGIGYATARPDVVAGVDWRANSSDPLQFLNPAAFVKNPGQFGNLGFNAVRGPGAFTFDGAIYKQFRITERQRFQFRAEFFNAFNHVVFGLPDGVMADSTFGRITSGSAGRNIQFGLKYLF